MQGNFRIGNIRITVGSSGFPLDLLMDELLGDSNPFVGSHMNNAAYDGRAIPGYLQILDGRDAREHNYRSPDGELYRAVYEKVRGILYITRNLTLIRENAHLANLEARPHTVDNQIVWLPPGPRPFSTGRVEQIEYI